MIALFLSLAQPAEACEKGCPMPTTTAALPAEGTHVTLAVTGMTCGSCASHVQEALMKIDGVKGAVVHYDTGKAEVAFDAKKTSTEKLIAAINALGTYQATAPAAG